jgi:hypothetical protein
VGINIYDIATNKLVYSGNLEAISTWWTFIDYPADRLLDDVLPKLITELYE